MFKLRHVEPVIIVYTVRCVVVNIPFARSLRRALEAAQHEHSAPGSAIAVDFIERSLIDKLGKDVDPATPPVVRAGVVQAKRMAELGEPWMFGIPQGGETVFLRSEGLEAREILPNNGLEATRRYRTRRDGTLVGSVPASDYLGARMLEGQRHAVLTKSPADRLPVELRYVQV